MSDTVVQVSEVQVVPGPGRTKLVTLPLAGEVVMGMRDEVATHYGLDEAEIDPAATTLDYLIGAAAGCMTGTLAGMLGALGQCVHDGALRASAAGTVVRDQGALRIAGIHMRYDLARDEGVTIADVERALERHHRHCPIARSIGGSIVLTHELHYR